MLGWNVTAHARERMHEMGVRERELRAALETCEVDYPDVYVGCRIRLGGRLAVAYNPTPNKIITVLWRGKETR
jgi:hypothetical protein